MSDENAVITAIAQRWPHLDVQRITDIVGQIVSAGGKPWTAAQIHEAFKQLVIKESPVPTTTEGRPPSLYTYTHTDAGNQISDRGIPQGPHTLGYGAIHEALYVGQGGGMTPERFDAQIATPDDWRESVQAELSQSQKSDDDLQARLNKARLSYIEYYTEALVLWGNMDGYDQVQTTAAIARIKLLMEHMMQLDPYATYAWANKNSDPDVSGHGENTDINNDKNLDTAGTFQIPGELGTYIDKRRQLV